MKLYIIWNQEWWQQNCTYLATKGVTSEECSMQTQFIESPLLCIQIEHIYSRHRTIIQIEYH